MRIENHLRIHHIMLYHFEKGWKVAESSCDLNESLQPTLSNFRRLPLLLEVPDPRNPMADFFFLLLQDFFRQFWTSSLNYLPTFTDYSLADKFVEISK